MRADGLLHVASSLLTPGEKGVEQLRSQTQARSQERSYTSCLWWTVKFVQTPCSMFCCEKQEWAAWPLSMLV